MKTRTHTGKTALLFSGVASVALYFAACKPQENEQKSVEAIKSGQLDQRIAGQCGSEKDGQGVDRVYAAAPKLYQSALKKESIKLVDQADLDAVKRCVVETWNNKVKLSEDEMKGLNAIWSPYDLLAKVKEKKDADCKAIAEELKAAAPSPTIYIKSGDQDAHIHANLIAMMGYAVFESFDGQLAQLEAKSATKTSLIDEAATGEQTEQASTDQLSQLRAIAGFRDAIAQMVLDGLKKDEKFSDKSYREKFAIAEGTDIMSSTALKNMFAVEAIDSLYCSRASAEELKTLLSNKDPKSTEPSDFDTLLGVAVNSDSFSEPKWHAEAVATKVEPAKQPAAEQPAEKKDEAAAK